MKCLKEMLVAQPDVETFLAAVLDKVLVTANPSSLKGLEAKNYFRDRASSRTYLGRELLELIRNEMDREGELVHTGLKEIVKNWITFNIEAEQLKNRSVRPSSYVIM